MAQKSFDVDDLLSDLVKSHKISALQKAARISSQVTCRTLGPNLPSSKGEENDKNIENVSKKAPESTVKENQDATKISSRSFHNITISDCDALNHKLYMQDLEKQRITRMKKEIDERQAKMREADRLRQERINGKRLVVEQNVAKKAQESEKVLLNVLETHERKAREDENKRKVEIDKENRRLTDINQKIKKQDEERKQRIMRMEKFRGFNTCFMRMADVFTRTIETMDRELSKKFLNQVRNVDSLTKIFEQMNQLILSKQDIEQNEVVRASELVKEMEKVNAEVVEMITTLRKELEEKEKHSKEKKQDVIDNNAQSPPIPPPPQIIPNKAEVKQPSIQESNILSQFVSNESLAFYNTVKVFYEQHQASVKSLMEDPNMKTYRFNLQKAVNVPINAISAVSREHLKDKYEKLAGLLSGGPIEGGISVNDHPLGKVYCTLLMAKRLVNQADTTVSSNMGAAFPIAAIVVALWQKFLDFGIFFLAYMHKECPYLVPYFLPQIQGQSAEEYFKSIGYRFENGSLEKQDKYLKRMTGLARLYSAVLVTKSRMNEGSPNPHGIEFGWKWLTNILNLEPLPDICATLILEFLQVAGFEMQLAFGKQFIKLLRVLQEHYLPKLNNVDSGGPKSRLEVLMLSIINEGKLTQCEGMLSSNFW